MLFSNLNKNAFLGLVRVMVINATFNNISVISWRSVLLEETTDLPQVTDKLYQIMLYWVHVAWAGFKLTTLVVICTDCIGSCKSNYYTITTAPLYIGKVAQATFGKENIDTYYKGNNSYKKHIRNMYWLVRCKLSFLRCVFHFKLKILKYFKHQ